MSTQNLENFSFKKYAWNQFKKDKVALVCLYLLFLLIVIAVFAPVIANDRPLYAEYKGYTLYPAFSDESRTDSIFSEEGKLDEILQYDITDWRTLDFKKVVWAPIPYSPESMDRYNRDYVSPGDKQRFKNKNGEITDAPKKFRHLLGTDGIGRDLASGLIHGTRISLMVGLVSMGIASLIGIFLGALAGFFGDNKLKMPRIKYHFTLIGLFFGLFYGFGHRKYALADGFSEGILSGMTELVISIGVLVLSMTVFRLISRLIKFKKLQEETFVPIDTFVSRGIELLNSIPRLLLIITITAVVERSIWIVMVIIGITSWTGIARFTRAEFLRIRSLEFVQASESLGFSSARTIFKHALPNALAPVFVSIAFGIASAILIESGLSFLGMGVKPPTPSWGSILNDGFALIRNTPWPIIAGSIPLVLATLGFTFLGESLRDLLDPKLRKLI